MRAMKVFFYSVAILLSLLVLSVNSYSKSFIRVCELEVEGVCDSIVVIGGEADSLLSLRAVVIDSVNIPLMHSEDFAGAEYLTWYSVDRRTLALKMPEAGRIKVIRLELVEFSTQRSLIVVEVFHQGNVVISKSFR